MLGSVQGLTVDIGLATWLALAVLVLLPAAGMLLYHGRSLPRLVWQGGIAVLAALTALAITDVTGQFERAALRRSLDARSTELTARALLPGSPLACLDGLANPTLEQACQKTLFANPESVAAAVAYVDARLALLADGHALALIDRDFAAGLERGRRALEADRFGMVAQALAARGCTPMQCPAFALLRDARRVADNIRDRSFDASIALHSPSWSNENSALASAHPPSGEGAVQVAIPTAGASPAAAPATTVGVPVSSRYDFPSADSIPAVSIMDPEPTRPPASTAKPAPAPRRAASKPAAEPQPAPAPPPAAAPR